MSKQTVDVIKRSLSDVADRFQLDVVDEIDQTNYSAVTYQNETTGLQVAIDWSELRPFFKLEERRSQSQRSSDARAQTCRTFDLDDLLKLRITGASPVGKMFSEREEQAAEPLLREYAHALQAHASDVFRGEFQVFDELERVVQGRMRSLE